MATTYAAYSNVMHGDKAQRQIDSTRSSVSSTGSKKTRWQRFVDELKPIEVAQEPVGFFTDLRPKKASTSSQKVSKSQRASKAYDAFKTKVGGEKVYFDL